MKALFTKCILMIWFINTLMANECIAQIVNVSYTRNTKQYELTNHLGNVLATISDSKKVGSNDVTILTTSDYYAFGMEIKERSYSLDGVFRYGYNGKENDRDWGTGLIQDYGFRLYNPGVGRFLSVDPLTKTFPELTTYQFASNSPLMGIDLDGGEIKIVTMIIDDSKGYLTVSRKMEKDKDIAVNIEKYKNKSIDIGGKIYAATYTYYEYRGQRFLYSASFEQLNTYGRRSEDDFVPAAKIDGGNNDEINKNWKSGKERPWLDFLKEDPRDDLYSENGNSDPFEVIANRISGKNTNGPPDANVGDAATTVKNKGKDVFIPIIDENGNSVRISVDNVKFSFSKNNSLKKIFEQLFLKKTKIHQD